MTSIMFGVFFAFLVTGENKADSISIVEPEGLPLVKLQKDRVDDVSGLVWNVRQQMVSATLQPYVNEQKPDCNSAMCYQVSHVGSYKLSVDDAGLPENSVETVSRFLIDVGSFSWGVRSVPGGYRNKDVRVSERQQEDVDSARAFAYRYSVNLTRPSGSTGGQDGGDDPERNNSWDKKNIPDDYMGGDDTKDKKRHHWCCVCFSRRKHPDSKPDKVVSISAPIDFQEGKPDESKLVSLKIAQERGEASASCEPNDKVFVIYTTKVQR